MSDKIKCATFDKAIRDAIPPEIRARMDADRAKAEHEMDKANRDLQGERQ